MKLFAVLSAGLVAAAVALPPAALAQMHSERTVQRTVVHTERHADARPRTHSVCKVTYRHHRKVRTCRTVRY